MNTLIKHYLLLAPLACMTANAWADDFSYTYNYSTPLVSQAGSNYTPTDGCQVVASADNKFFTLAQYGNVANTSSVSFYGCEIASPAAALYDGTSYNHAIVLTKHDAKGNVIWQINSTEGDATGGSVVVPLSDGGCALALKLRYENTSEYKSNILLNIADASGNKTKLTADFSDNMFTDNNFHRAYYPALVRIDANGKVTNYKIFDTDHTAAANAKSTYSYGTTDGFALNDACADADDNIYIAGYLRSNMLIGSNTVEAHNVSSWNGDTQSACGSAYLIKFDSDLNYTSHITSVSSATNDQIGNITYADGNIYVVGQTTARTSLSFAGQSDTSADASPESKTEMWVASVAATDLKGNYLRIYPTVATATNAIHLRCIATQGNYIYVSGAVQKGGFTLDNGTNVAPEKITYSSFVGKIDISNGALQNTYILNGSISEFSAVAPNTDGTLFAFGYDWATATTTGNAVNLYQFTSDLELSNTVNIYNQKAMPVTYDMARIADDYVFLSRMGKSAKPTLLNSTDGLTATDAFTAIAYGYTITNPNIVTPAPTIAQSNVTLRAQRGALSISNADGVVVSVCDISGRIVATKSAAESSATLALPHGLYIVSYGNRNQKILVK